MSLPLNDLCELIVDCPHSTAPDEGKGYPLIRTPNIGPGYLDLDDVHRVSKETYDIRNARAIPQPMDLILAREAPAGNVGIIKAGQWVCLGQRTVLIRPDRKKVDPWFLNYYLNAPRQRHRLLSNANGATVSHVNMPIIRNLPIDLPSMKTQRRIASILMTYDNLIENNRRQISLLEKAMRHLYKEWFVDLHYPGYEDTECVNGIPKGWRKVPLLDCIDKEIGGGWGQESSSHEFSENGYVIRATDIASVEEGDTASVPLRWHKPTNIRNRKLGVGDIIFEVSGGSREHGVGRSMLVTQEELDSFDAPVICASFCKRIKPKQGLSSLLADCISYEFHTDGLREYEKRSAGNIINFHWKTFLYDFKLLIPDEDVLSNYIRHIKTFRDRKNIASQIIRIAREARNRLLPKLMSGEIKVEW